MRFTYCRTAAERREAELYWNSVDAAADKAEFVWVSGYERFAYQSSNGDCCALGSEPPPVDGVSLNCGGALLRYAPVHALTVYNRRMEGQLVYREPCFGLREFLRSKGF
jgi:hypothetical protein